MATAKDEISAVFTHPDRKSVSCIINGQGYTYPVGVPVVVSESVANVIGGYTKVGPPAAKPAADNSADTPAPAAAPAVKPAKK